MSYIVGTSTASFCRGEDHPRSVAVPVRGVAAVQALEGPFGQPEAHLCTASFHSQRQRCHSAVSARSARTPGRRR